MLKFFIGILMIVTSLRATAGWEVLIEMPAGKVYIDRLTIKRVGGMATMLSLTDLTFSEQQLKDTPPSFRSTIQQDSYDCIGKRMRLQSYTLYSGPMATGTPFMQYNEGMPWAALDPKSQNVLKWRAACSLEQSK